MHSWAIQMAVALSALGAAALVCADDIVSLEPVEAEGGRVVAVAAAGLSADVLAVLEDGATARDELEKILKVYAGEDAVAERPPVLGRVRVEEGRLVFRPRFPFKPGLAYRVVLRLPGSTDGRDSVLNARVIERIIRVEEEAPREPTTIEAVYPSGDVLPENLLKFYLHFSAPMAQGRLYDHVRLVDAAGEEIEYPFVNVGRELWDRSGTRVTLLLDPGRIKRGLRPREEIGPILVEGRAYELVIDGSWPDARGQPLGRPFRKSFRAAPPDDVQPDPSKWQIDPPRSRSATPLTIRFEEPLDHAMLHSACAVLAVQSEQQTPVAGRIEVSEEETLWRFVPEKEWNEGDYVIQVDTSLEDRAGNSIGRPFEVDVFEKVQARVTQERIAIPFRVR